MTGQRLTAEELQAEYETISSRGLSTKRLRVHIEAVEAELKEAESLKWRGRALSAEAELSALRAALGTAVEALEKLPHRRDCRINPGGTDHGGVGRP